MRVLLDNAYGGPWYRSIKRPAIRHIDAVGLARAVGLAEAVVGDPALLGALNRRSLAWRLADRDRSR